MRDSGVMTNYKVGNLLMETDLAMFLSLYDLTLDEL